MNKLVKYACVVAVSAAGAYAAIRLIASKRFKKQDFIEGEGDEDNESEISEDGIFSVDTTGDGNVDTYMMDTDKDGQIDTVLLDTDGDGEIDTALTDTTGDGELDTVSSLT